MPVQIDELIITTTVDAQATGTNTGGSSTQDTSLSDEEIAEKVLQVIREKTER